MSAAATPLREHGGKGQIKPEDKPGPGFKAVGILYIKELSPETVEIKVLYEKHVSQAVKDAIAAACGVGAKEWSVT